METWDYIGEEGKGKHKLTIDPGQGAPIQVYYGKTKEEVMQNLIQAQASATRHIAELRRNTPKPGEALPPAKPPRRAGGPLSENERFQIANDITDPAKVDKAVRRVVESVTGVTVEQINANNVEADLSRAEKKAQEAATAFVQDEPDWFPSEHNKQTMVGYMKNMGLDHANVEDYRRAFRELSAAGLLQARPDDETEEEPETPTRQERISPSHGANGRPRSMATGVRSSDISGQPPRPSSRVKWTPEEIARMGKAEYKRLWESDPDFQRAAENYKPTQEGQPRRTR